MVIDSEETTEEISLPSSENSDEMDSNKALTQNTSKSLPATNPKDWLTNPEYKWDSFPPMFLEQLL